MIKYVLERLESLIILYTNGVAPNKNKDLMADPVYLSPHDMAAFFLDIEKEFSIKLNSLVPSLEVYSPMSIAEKINILIN